MAESFSIPRLQGFIEEYREFYSNWHECHCAVGRFGGEWWLFRYEADYRNVGEDGITTLAQASSRGRWNSVRRAEKSDLKSAGIKE